VAIDPWLPIGFVLPDGTQIRKTVVAGEAWQIVNAQEGKRVLLALPELTSRWQRAGLTESGTFASSGFGPHRFDYLVSAPHHLLTVVNEASGPSNKSEALAFASALRASRTIDAESAFQDALYVEKLTRLLPSYSVGTRTPDDVVLGYWLSGGVPVSAESFRRLHQAVSWLSIEHLRDVVEAAGFEVREIVASAKAARPEAADVDPEGQSTPRNGLMDEPFRLPGRPDLERFINEHVLDVLRHRERYKALGLGFPGAVVLHGPPGSGKTFAIERLVAYLGWPSYQIDASSVASPFIHETSRKIADVFEKAQQNAPSVLIIDEMEAFLADRESGGGGSHHRVEEVAEFLRRIPEATRNDVLVVAMTNRLGMIDSAILRRGRFDHVISVGYASAEEVHALLEKLLSDLPTDSTVDARTLARGLSNRPLSDVAFVIREGARLAARAGKSVVDQESLIQALNAAPERAEDEAPRRVGFL